MPLEEAAFSAFPLSLWLRLTRSKKRLLEEATGEGGELARPVESAGESAQVHADSRRPSNTQQAAAAAAALALSVSLQVASSPCGRLVCSQSCGQIAPEQAAAIWQWHGSRRRRAHRWTAQREREREREQSRGDKGLLVWQTKRAWAPKIRRPSGTFDSL